MSFDPEKALQKRKEKRSVTEALGYAGSFDPKEALRKRGKQQPSLAAAEDVLGGEFIRGKVASLGLRFDLARGDTLEEKNLRIQKIYPEGEVQVFGPSIVAGIEDEVLLYRESPREQWGVVDPPGFTTSKDGEVSRFNLVNWDWADIAEAFAPSFEATIGEIGTLALTKGASVPAVLVKQMLGAMLGESVEQIAQSARGVQAQNIQEQLVETGTEGAFSLGGGILASPFSFANNALRGRGGLRVGEEGMETLQAAQRLSPDIRMTPATVVDNPAIKLSERQAAALLPGLQRAYRSAIAELDRVVRASGDPKVAAEASGRLVSRLKNWSNDLINKLGSKRISWRKSGQALQEGIEEYDQIARAINDRLYKEANDIAEPEFDWMGVYGLSNDIRAGKYGRINKNVDQAIKDINAITGPIELSDGEILTVTQQIRNVRTTLGIIAENKDLLTDQGQLQAIKLSRKITDMLESPLNPDPDFLKAWGAANAASRERIRTLKQAAIIGAANTETPAALAAGLAKPGKVDDLITVRNAVDPKYWNDFRQTFISDALNQDAPLTYLQKFDDETFEVLIRPNERAPLKTVARELERIKNIGAEEMLERQVTNMNFVDELIRTGNARDVVTIMKSINNVNDKPARDSLRAAVVQWAWQDVVYASKNTLKVNEALLDSNIKQLQKIGLWGALSGSQRSVVSDARLIARAFNTMIDAGTSIQAASAVQGVKEFRPSAIKTFINNYILEQVYLSDSGRKILLGTGLPNSNGARLRILASALARVSTTEDLSLLANEDK
jgi:hypothetical protein